MSQRTQEQAALVEQEFRQPTNSTRHTSMGNSPGSRCLENPTSRAAFRKGAGMSYSAEQIQSHAVGQPAMGADNRKIQKALSVLELAGCVTLSLFFAGIVAPSFLRSGVATSHALTAGSLHALTIGRVTLWFTLPNVASALLGGLFGALISLAIEFPGALARASRIFLLCRRVDWIGFLSRQPGRPGYVD